MAFQSHIQLCCLSVIAFYILLPTPCAIALNFNIAQIRPQNLNADIAIKGDAYFSSEGIHLAVDEHTTNFQQKAGRATYIKPLHLWDKVSGKLADFTSHFSFVIDSNRNFNFGDGLAFFLEPFDSSCTARIIAGGAIGLPINPLTLVPTSQFVAVEFDTFRNSWDPHKYSDMKMAILSFSISQNAFSPRHSRHRLKALNLQPPIQINCSASRDGDKLEESSASLKELRKVTCGILAVWAVATASPVIAANQRLPPLSTEPNRCERAFVGNTIGQANGVYDKPIDLRFCDYTNDKSKLKGKSLAAALMSEAKFDGADMTEVVMSKAYAVGASFKGVDFSNAVLDRVNFAKADLKGAVFRNTVLSGSTFNEAQLEDAVFEDTIIGYIDLQKLCTNTTISDEGRAELGCR